MKIIKEHNFHQIIIIYYYFNFIYQILFLKTQHLLILNIFLRLNSQIKN